MILQEVALGCTQRIKSVIDFGSMEVQQLMTAIVTMLFPVHSKLDLKPRRKISGVIGITKVTMVTVFLSVTVEAQPHGRMIIKSIIMEDSVDSQIPVFLVQFCQVTVVQGTLVLIVPLHHTANFILGPIMGISP